MSALERMLRRERDRLDRAVVEALEETVDELQHHRRKDAAQDERLTALEERIAKVEARLAGKDAVPEFVIKDLQRRAARLKAIADSVS
jgi:uncharacterized protein YicC (UPF0701 family)